MAATGLQPSGGVFQEGWQCETKVHRVHSVSRAISLSRQPSTLSGAVPRVVISTLATAAAMSGGLAWTGQPKVASNRLGAPFPGSDPRFEQEHREHNSNSPPVGSHANCQTDVEQAEDNVLSPQDPVFGSYIGQNTL